MRPPSPFPLAAALLGLIAGSGCLSLTTTRTEPATFGPDGVRRFDAATVVVSTGEGDRTREADGLGVVVRPDSTFWQDARRVERAGGFDLRRMRRGRASDVPVEAVPTRLVREVVTRRPAPQVRRGALNGLTFGLGLGIPLVALGRRLDAGSPDPGSNAGLGADLVITTGATALGLTFGMLGARKAKARVHHRLNDTPPAP